MGQIHLNSLLLVSLLSSVLLIAADDVHLRRRSMTVHEKRTSIPHEYSKVGDADLDVVMNFRVGLKPMDISGLEKALYDVSNPSSPSYGRHLTVDEVSDLQT